MIMSRVSDGPEYDFGPYEDEYRGFEIRDDETGRGPLILVLALGVLLIFAGVVWNTYRQGVRPTEGGLPVIASDETPYKRAPDQRGGFEVAGQENGFYNQMDGLGDPALSQKTSVRNPVEIRRSSPVLSGGPAELPPVEEGVPIAPAPVTPVPVRSAALDGLDERALEVAEAPVRTASLGPVDITPARERPVVDVTPPQRRSADARFASGGAYQVQLMAVRSETAAQSAWTKVRNGAPGLYRGAKLDVQRADLGARGVFFRLRIGSFESRDVAKGFCLDVKATGRDCIVVAKATG